VLLQKLRVLISLAPVHADAVDKHELPEGHVVEVRPHVLRVPRADVPLGRFLQVPAHVLQAALEEEEPHALRVPGELLLQDAVAQGEVAVRTAKDVGDDEVVSQKGHHAQHLFVNRLLITSFLQGYYDTLVPKGHCLKNESFSSDWP